MTGVKLEVGIYANSLNGPKLLMFSFGILIPIIIATMLPITGIGKNSVFGIILVMDVFLPIALLLYARRILFNRPVFNFNMVSNDVGKKKQTNSIKRLLFFSASILLSIPGILIYLGYFPALQPRFGALIILLAASGGPALFILTSTRDSRKRRKLIAQMDREFPDALFQLGMCISEGASLEHGLESTGEVLKGTKISGLFLGLISRIRFEQNSLRALLEDRDALGLDMSDTIYATLNVVVSAVEKNSNDAGEIMIDISNYLRDLRTMDEMLRQKLSELLGTIKQTGMIFAPLIIGLTTAMYFKLNDNLAGIEFSGGIGFGSIGTTEPIAGEAFILIFGVFLLLTFSVIVYFITGLEYGGNTGIFKEEFGKGAIIAMSIFSASCIMGFKFFGV